MEGLNKMDDLNSIKKALETNLENVYVTDDLKEKPS